MAPRKLTILLFLSLSIVLALSSCLPIPFTGGSQILSAQDVQATVQNGIERTLTAQRRIQDATANAREAASAQSTNTENMPGSDSDTPTLPVLPSLEARTITSTHTITATESPTDIPPTLTSTPSNTPQPTNTLQPTSTRKPTKTPFDPNVTPTHTPPPTITPPGYQAPPNTPVPPTRVPTRTPEPEVAEPDLVLLQVETAAYCRSGPGRSYDLLDALLPEEWAQVVGRSLNQNYYVIQTPRGSDPCWLWSRNVEIDGALDGLPTMDAPDAPPLPEFTHSQDTVCRAGPEDSQPEIATLPGETSAEIIGRTEMNTWLLVRVPLRWFSCWVSGEDAQLTGNLQAAPVLGASIPSTGETPGPVETAPTATIAATAEPTQPAAAKPPAAQPVMTPVAGLACRIMSQSPSSTTTISPNASFEASWTVRNIGTKTWESGIVDIHFLAGSRIHRSPDQFDLPQSIYTGEAITIKLQMAAPGSPGRYNINWAMSDADSPFCALPLTLEVR